MSSYRASDDELLPTADPAGTLGPVVRAATAPAHAAELAGEGAAMAAFRATATMPRPSRFRSVVARLLTVKAVLAVTVAGSTGIVLAATGSLPSPWSEPPPAPPSVTVPAPVPAETGGQSAKPADPVEPAEPADREDEPSRDRPRRPDRPERDGRSPDRHDDRPDRPGRDTDKDKNTDVHPPGRDDDEDGDDDSDDGDNQRPAPDPGGHEPSPPAPPPGGPSAPGSPARGAAPSVPPSGITPPSQGG